MTSTRTCDTYSPARIAQRPLVLMALNVLGVSDAEVARWLGLAPQTVAHWTHGRRPVRLIHEHVLLYVVARIVGIIGPDDPPLTPLAMTRLNAAHEAAKLLAAAARDELPDVSDEIAGRCAELGEKLLAQIEAQARAEYKQLAAQARAEYAERERLLRKGDEILKAHEDYKREAAKREKVILAERKHRGK